MNDASGGPARKASYTGAALLRRFLGSVLDPRAYLHALRIVNHYNNVHVKPRRRITMGPGPRISPTASFSYGERITLGRNAHVNAHCTLWAGPGHGRITIGDDVLLGPDVLMTAASYRYNDGAPVTDQAMNEADVEIGDDVWIGAKAVILPGARIGAGAVIAAASVVRGEIPPMAIAAGNPAAVVGWRRRPAAAEDAADGPGSPPDGTP